MTILQFAHMNDADATKSLTPLSISFSLAGDNVLVGGVASQKIYVYRLFLVVTNNTNLTFKDGVSTNLTGAMPMVANGSLVYDLSNVPWFQTSAGKDFILNSSALGQVSGALYYQQL